MGLYLAGNGMGGTGMDTPKPFPDYDAFQKGTVVSVETIEHLVGCKRDDPHFRLKMMGLAQDIEQHRADSDDPVVCKTTADTIEILTDEQADEYTSKQFEQGRRKMARNLRRKLGQVDPTMLSETQRRVRDRELFAMGSEIAAMRKERRRIRLKQKQELLEDESESNGSG